MKQKARQLVVSYLWITLASAIYALGFDWCYAPNEIGFGGITGLAQIINAALPWAPIGVVVILLNIPLFFFGWRLLGGHLLFSSLYAMFVSSIFVDLLNAFVQFTPMDPMLATIFGGILIGLSLAIILLQGATTGGTDLFARLLKLKIFLAPHGKAPHGGGPGGHRRGGPGLPQPVQRALRRGLPLHLHRCNGHGPLRHGQRQGGLYHLQPAGGDPPRPSSPRWTGASPSSTQRAAGPANPRRSCSVPSSKSRSSPCGAW